MWPIGLRIQDLLRLFSERRKTNSGKIADFSIMHMRNFELLLPSVAVLLIRSFLEGTERYSCEYLLLCY